MSILEWRGGFPVVFVGTVTTAGVITDSRGGVIPAGSPIILGAHQVQDEVEGRRGPVTSKWLRIVNHDIANDLHVFFSQDHFDDDSHYVNVDSQAGVGEHSVFQGPAEATQIWVKGVGGDADFELTAFSRRG